MNLVDKMRDFEAHLRLGDNESALDMINRDKSFARSHVKDGGVFVTPLDLAMDYGNVLLCDAALKNGARYDLPVGAPPSGSTGRTSLSRVLSEGYTNTVSNREEMVDLFARHHAIRTSNISRPSIFTTLKEKSAAFMSKIVSGLERVLATDTAKLGFVTMPAAALGVKLGVTAALGAAGAAAATPLLVGTAFIGAAGLLAHKFAEQNSMDKLSLRGRHADAVETMDNLAKPHLAAMKQAKASTGQLSRLASSFAPSHKREPSVRTKRATP